MEAAYELKGIRKVFGEGEGSIAVLKGIDLSVESGERVAIVGPSGSGKSTLLHLMAGLDRPSEGTLRFYGEPLNESRRRGIGIVFQKHHLLPQCTVLENVLVPAIGLSGQATDADEKHAREILASVGLEHRVNHVPAKLSGGERLRSAVARALMCLPESEEGVLLADEPTGALDRKNAELLGEMLLDLKRTLVVVTHSEALAEQMDRQVVLADGLLGNR